MDAVNQHTSLFTISAKPTWLKAIDNQPILVEHESPYSYPLIDYQELVAHDRIESYVETWQIINDASRIEDASLLIEELHKGSQTMQVHHLKIIRQEQEIDALDEENIGINQRELGLENHISDNRITVSISVDDLRVGDCLQYAYTIVERVSDHPLHGRSFLRNTATSWSCPVDLQRLRVVNDSSKALTILDFQLRQQEGETPTVGEELATSEISAGETWERIVKSAPLRRIPQTAPSTFWGSFIQVATKASWPEVSQYLYHYYQTQDTTTSLQESDLAQLKLYEPHASEEEKALSIIRFIQNEVRYKGENQGIFTHTPKDPNRVLRKRAGDCKDKSNLIVALLSLIDIPSHLVLAHSSNGEKAKQLAPSAYQFNHMIVAVELNNQWHYFDATIKKQGGDLDHYSKLNYSYVLPITAQGSKLIELSTISDQLAFHLQHSFDFRGKPDEHKMTVKREYWGVRADNMRAQLAGVDKQQNELDYSEWATESTGLKLEPIEAINVVSDDLQKNHLCTQESYQIKDLSSTHKDKRVELLTQFYKDLNETNTVDYPIAIELYGQAKHTIQVFYRKRPDMQVTEKTIDSYGFIYRDRVEALNANEYRYTTVLTPKLVKQIPAGSLAEKHNQDVTRVRNRSNNLIKHENQSTWSEFEKSLPALGYVALFALIFAITIILDN